MQKAVWFFAKVRRGYLAIFTPQSTQTMFVFRLTRSVMRWTYAKGSCVCRYLRSPLANRCQGRLGQRRACGEASGAPCREADHTL